MRYFAEISYDGSAFHGWQIQPNACSVQEEIQTKMERILQIPIQVTGCGRTDTGVHASQFFLHFDADLDLDSDFVYTMNQVLVPEIAVHNLWLCNEEMHARFDAKSRSYRYKLHNAKSPFHRHVSYYFRPELDLEIMNAGANVIAGHTHFDAFCKSRTDNKTDICRIDHCRWIKDGHRLEFEVTADRFLRNMVRAMVGTLLLVGQGKLSLDELDNILQSRKRSNAGESVPAHALFLEKVEYDQTTWRKVG